jgi:hypothetical protein
VNFVVEFLVTRWREILIAFLVAAMTTTWNMYTGAKEHGMKLEIEFKLKVEQAEQTAKIVQQRSQQTLERLNANHEKQLAAAKTNAVKNFIANQSASTGMYGLRLPSHGPGFAAGASVAASTSLPDETPEEPVSFGCTREFITNAAEDALAVTEWQKWARMNRLPVEGEQ